MTAMAATPSSPEIPSPRVMVRGLVFDVGLPIAAYYALHLLGASDWVALLAASGIAALRILWSAVRQRRFNAFATVMLLVYGIGFALAFATGDPRTLLLRNSLITASVGIVFLVTAIRGRRPLTLAALESFAPAKAAAAAEAYATDARVRHGHRLSSTVWGVGLIAESIIRIPLVYQLPVDVSVGATEALWIAAFAGLMVWNGWYVRRAQKRRGSAPGTVGGTPA
ncbi:hypothetical protein LWC33_14250 [Pseudonocardia sp. RS11V-5]|uniref:VC0807 family protein n=1 Tax=Pseudonocardia terrae TaxID=2905831 RepID=UPI001E651884|nr:VC0807 family protein [Pseudonocardia terrae]MCE3552615.1 hypothetical protein [Pseudonocardia terrae]